MAVAAWTKVTCALFGLELLPGQRSKASTSAWGRVRPTAPTSAFPIEAATAIPARDAAT